MPKITAQTGIFVKYFIYIYCKFLINYYYFVFFLFSISPVPDYDKQHSRVAGGMRPAISLAQLCEMDPEETPSSRGLIAQWENLIQQNA